MENWLVKWKLKVEVVETGSCVICHKYASMSYSISIVMIQLTSGSN